MVAEKTLGLKRIKHTGPLLTLAPNPVGDNDDREIGPPQPGNSLYFHSKYLAEELFELLLLSMTRFKQWNSFYCQ
jgi:hypothetical protein